MPLLYSRFTEHSPQFPREKLIQAILKNMGLALFTVAFDLSSALHLIKILYERWDA